MNQDAHRTALYFDGRIGFAKADGVSVSLESVPRLAPLPTHTSEAYFYPQLRDYRLRESAKAIREMYPPEIEAILKFLSSIADFGRRLRAGI